jgi:hypothetical protein
MKHTPHDAKAFAAVHAPLQAHFSTQAGATPHRGACVASAVEKRANTLRACAALAGYEFVSIEGDNGRPEYILTRGAMCERFANLDDVEIWLASIGAVEVACLA